MWVTLVHAGAIARIGADGATTVFPVAPDAKPSIITAGADGALWFTRNGDDRIGRIGTDGQLRDYELPGGSAPFGIAADADGVWFTATGWGIGRLDLDGTLTDRVPVSGMASMIVTGPDGALWFTVHEANAVGRYSPSGGLTLRELPTPGAGPVGIAASHDDTVWFTEIRAEQIGRIPMSDAIQEMALPGRPHAVVADPSGGVWVSLWGADQLARVSADGEVSTVDLPAGSEPHGMAIAADGALWVALEAGFVLRLPTG